MRPASGYRRVAAGPQGSFTLDRYGHLYPEADRALRDRLGRFHEAAGDAEQGATWTGCAPETPRAPSSGKPTTLWPAGMGGGPART
jgi:hypothetical protein